MRKLTCCFFALLSPLCAQSINDFTLDPRKVVELPVSHEVTAVTLPGPITAIAGSDMLLDGGQPAGAEVDEGTPVRFHVTHVPGSNFFLVQDVQPNATGTLTVIFEGAAYVLHLRDVAANPVASAIFERPAVATAVKVQVPPEPVHFSPRIGLSVLDRARAYPVLLRALPKAVEGVTVSRQHRTIDLPDLAIEVQEVYRFSKEDAVVFLLHLTNKTDGTLAIAPSSFAARVGEEKFQESIANGPRTLPPKGTADAEFAVVGMPDGTRNDLSAENAFTVLVNTSRDPAEAADPAVAKVEPSP
jgi:hypothetical protein